MVAAAAAGAARAGAAGAGGRAAAVEKVAPTGSAPVGAGAQAGRPAGRKAATGRTGGGSPRRKGGSSGDAAGFLSGSLFGKTFDKGSRTVLPPSGARRVLVAEFTACMAIVAFSPLTDKHKDEAPASVMKRFTAVMGVFFLLAITASGGRGASRAAAGFGGLVTLALALSNRNIFVVIARKMATTSDETPDGGGVEVDDRLEDKAPAPDPPHPDFGRVLPELRQSLPGRAQAESRRR